jgi:hypothetical protein
MREQADKPNGKRRRWRWGKWVAIALVLYVLSFGPVDAFRLTGGPEWIDRPIHIVYSPIECIDDWAAENCVPLYLAYGWYVDLWVEFWFKIS